LINGIVTIRLARRQFSSTESLFYCRKLDNHTFTLSLHTTGILSDAAFHWGHHQSLWLCYPISKTSTEVLNTDWNLEKCTM